MVTIRSQEEIEKIRQSALLVSKTLAYVAEILQPGMTGLDLDKKAEEFIRDAGGVPAFKGFKGFPGSLCISGNDTVVHGLPNKTPFKEAEIISVDCGVKMNGYFGDSAYTFGIGEVPQAIQDLMIRTKESLFLGIASAGAGKRIGDIGHAIQSFVESFGYGVVRELVGHGIGEDLHEAPEVPNFGRTGQGVMLKEGMVIAIEPMVNLGGKNIYQDKDGWTIKTRDGKASAHFEHTIAIERNEANILSDHRLIEDSLKKNPNLVNI